MTRATSPRLSSEARRAQLVAVGLKMLETIPFHTLSIDDVADRVGISRSLLFHYFPSKQAYLTEVVRAGAQHVIDLTEPPDSVRGEDRQRAIISAFVRFIRRRRSNYLTVIRAAPSVNPGLEEITNSMHEVLARRLLRESGHPDPDRFQVLAARVVVAGIEELALLCDGDDFDTDVIVNSALHGYRLGTQPSSIEILRSSQQEP